MEYAEVLQNYYPDPLKAQRNNDQWPPPPTSKVFKLSMIKRRRVQRGVIDERINDLIKTGRVENILVEKQDEVDIEDIFKRREGKRKIVLMEGAPGSGKSTLALDSVHQWGENKLFEEYKVVILVQLRDPKVQKADSIAGLLPYCANPTEIANEIMKKRGKGILWILDGWDELPSNLQQNSIPCQLIQSADLCPESAVIVTSRPISSLALHDFVSSRIEVLGFTQKDLKEYFIECLKNDEEALKKLMESIDDNPSVASSCYLPLNASILVHLFLSENNSLPATQFELYSSLVLNCIIRHLKREGDESPSPESLERLPESVKEPFDFLCELAYKGVKKNEVIFSDLPQDVNTLSLLQGVESHVDNRKSTFFNFFHLAIQEFLAALHIANQLEESEQVKEFQELYHEPRFSAVFQFYSAFTKLQTPGINDVLAQVVADYIDQKRNATIDKHKKRMIRFVSLLHCLFEAQSPALCQEIAQHLDKELDLHFYTLAPVDGLVIGYFLSSLYTTCGEFKVDLQSCAIGDLGCKFLAKELYRKSCGDTNVTLKLDLKLDANDIHEDGSQEVGHLLSGSSVVQKLSLLTADLGDRGVGIDGLRYIADGMCTNKSLIELDLSYQWLEVTAENGQSLKRMLKENDTLDILHMGYNRCESDRRAYYIAEGLKNNVALHTLDLRNSDLTPSGIEHLAGALKYGSPLEILTLSFNTHVNDEGLKYLGDALKQNTSLRKLDVSMCGLTSRGAEYLAIALETNHHLEELNISDNPVGDDGIQYLSERLGKNDSLKVLYLKECDFTSKGAQFIAIALKANKTLYELDISANTISDDGIKSIATSLECIHSLRILTLNDCDLTPKGAEYLATALKVNSLEGLDISDNDVCDNGVIQLAHALKINKTLKLLDLSHCRMTDTGIKELATSIEGLETLKVGANSRITKDGMSTLMDHLKDNKTLSKLVFPGELKSSLQLIQSFHEKRKRKGLPDIKVEGKHLSALSIGFIHACMYACDLFN